jgi:hypothetical protein
MRCEVADESVVVMKFRPEKPGNRVEEKTGMTCSLVCRGWSEPKAWSGAKGGSIFEDFLEVVNDDRAGHKLFDGAGHFIGGKW